MGVDIQEVLRAVMSQNSMLKRELADLKKRIEDSGKEIQHRHLRRVHHRDRRLKPQRLRRVQARPPSERFRSFQELSDEENLGSYLIQFNGNREYVMTSDVELHPYRNLGLEHFRLDTKEGKWQGLHTPEPKEG